MAGFAVTKRGLEPDATGAQPGQLPANAERNTNKDQPSGYAGLDGGGLLKTGEFPPSALMDTRGVAAGDLLLFNGASFTRLARGSTGQVLHVRIDGTVYWATPQRISATDWGVVADGVQTTATTTAASNVVAVPTGQVKAGQLFCILSAGVGQKPLVGVIGSVTPGNPNDSVTLATSALFNSQSVTATYSLSSVTMYAATDDQPAWQNIINTLAPTGAIVEAPNGKSGLGSTVDFNTKSINNYFALLAIRGAGGTGAGGSAKGPATTFWNFSQDEAFVACGFAGQNMFGLEESGFMVQSLQEPATRDVASIYHTGWGANGKLEDVRVFARGLAGGSVFTGTIVPGTPDTITGVAVTNYPKVGDYVYVQSGTGTIVVGTTITAISGDGLTYTLSSSGTATSGSATLWAFSSSPGIGFWLDNPGSGAMVIDQIHAENFASSPQGVNGPQVSSQYSGEGIRFSAQAYTTTGITGTVGALSGGFATVTGISSFVGWKPGAAITVTAGTGAITSGFVSKVNRMNGTAVIWAASVTPGTVTMTLAQATINSGNFSCRCLFTNFCTYGVRFFGTTAALIDGAHVAVIKCTESTVGVQFETGWNITQVDAVHIEGVYQGVRFTGQCSRNKIRGILFSRSNATIGDGSTAIQFDTGAYGNTVEDAVFLATFDYWVIFAQSGTTAGNYVRGGAPASGTTATALTAKVKTSVTYPNQNVWVDTTYARQWITPGGAYGGPGGTTAPAYAANFSSNNASHPFGYRVSDDGMLEFQGEIHTSALTLANTTMFTLPVDLRPPVTYILPIRDSINGFNYIQIASAGTVNLIGAMSGAGNIDITGRIPLLA